MKELRLEYNNMSIKASKPVQLCDENLKDIKLLREGVERIQKIENERNQKRRNENIATVPIESLKATHLLPESSQDGTKGKTNEVGNMEIEKPDIDSQDQNKESMVSETLSKDDKAKSESEGDQLQTIIDVFTNMGELLLLKETDTIVTDPGFFCKELVENIINHKIICSEKKVTLEDLQKLEKMRFKNERVNPEHRKELLKFGFLLKIQLQEEHKIDGKDKENLIWDMLEKTKLGEKLSEIRMFVPLLISESLWRDMKESELMFQEKMKKTKFAFTARFDIDKNFQMWTSTELFHKISCSVALHERMKLLLSYSKDLEKRRSGEPLISLLSGTYKGQETETDPRSQFLLFLFQEYEGSKCYYSIIVQAYSEDKKKDLVAIQDLVTSIVEETVQDLDSSTRKSISYKKISRDNERECFTKSKPDEFLQLGKQINVMLLMLGAILSFADVITDFLQGTNLMKNSQGMSDAQVKELRNLGLFVIAVCWIPGLITAAYIYADLGKTTKTKNCYDWIWYFIGFVFYPFVPTISHILLINNKSYMDTDEEDFFFKMIDINGFLENPLQLMVTVFLFMKGILSMEMAFGEWHDQFNNIRIPLISAVFSIFGMLKATATMNIYKFNEESNVSKLLIFGGHFPVLFGTVCFRIFSYSLMMVYLNELAILPILLVILSNLGISKIVTKDENGKNWKIKAPILDSFLGIFVPSSNLDVQCKSSNDIEMQPLTSDTETDWNRKCGEKMKMEMKKTIEKKIIRWQILTSTTLILCCLGLIFYLVNYDTAFKYHPNILNNDKFKVIFWVLLSLGVINLIFMLDMNKKMKYGKAIKATATVLSLVLVLIPWTVGGIVIFSSNVPSSIYMVMNTITQDSIEITVIKTRTFHVSQNQSEVSWNSNFLSLRDENFPELINCEFMFGNQYLVVDRFHCSERCYENLKRLEPDCLKFQSIIILDDKESIYHTSRPLVFFDKLPLNIPIVSIPIDKEAYNLDKILESNNTSIKLLTDKNFNNILTCVAKRNIIGNQVKRCLRIDSALKLPMNIVGCHEPLTINITYQCFNNGQKCPDEQSWLKKDKIIDSSGCNMNQNFEI